MLAGSMVLVASAVAHFGGKVLADRAIQDFEVELSDNHAPETGKLRPVAVLRINNLDLAVPVYSGTDPRTLARGAGWLPESAPLGASGNAAIAAHRDSFFAPLERVAVGDVLQLRTSRGDHAYKVTEIRIVDPLDVSVLDPSEEPVLTLITCYPFRYVGAAPDRFIVRAVIM